MISIGESIKRALSDCCSGRGKESAAPLFFLVWGWPRPCANSRRLDVRLRPDWSVEQGQLAVESVLPADEALTAGDAPPTPGMDVDLSSRAVGGEGRCTRVP